MIIENLNYKNVNYKIKNVNYKIKNVNYKIKNVNYKNIHQILLLLLYIFIQKIYIMGNSQQKQKVNFEDVQFVIKNSDKHLLINTMLENYQNCLIVNTIPIDKEELVINKLLNNGDGKNIKIIIYGKNANDETPIKKCEQLLSLGFSNVYIYPGGLFEWLLLQDIYGTELFPTTSKQNDLLKYKPNKLLNIPLIEY